MTALERFRIDNRLSFMELATLCGGAAAGCNRTAIRSICLGEAGERMLTRLKPAILAGLEGYCRLNRLPANLAEKIWAGTQPAPENDEMNLKGDYQTMLPPTTLPYECLKAFGLERDPFGLETLPNEIFKSEEHDFVFAGIVRAIQTAGFCAVLGETGSGKSVMQTRLAEWASHQGRKIHLIPFQSEEIEAIYPGHITSTILRYFDMKVPSDRAWRGKMLTRALGSANEQGFKVAVSIDDCHATNRQLVASLKRFNEKGAVGTKFLSVLLWGQPQFERRLLDPTHNEIRQRLTILKMPQMSKFVRSYLDSKLALVNGKLDRIFTTEAVEALARVYQTPLGIQNAAALAMLTAWQRGADRVSAEFVFVPNEPKVQSVRPVKKPA